jgi:nucleoid-associated protein
MDKTASRSKNKKLSEFKPTPLSFRSPASPPERILKVSKLAIHAVRKNLTTKKFDLEDSKGLSHIDEDAETLIQALDDSYNRSSMMYAILDSSADLKFPAAFQKFIKKRNRDDEFLSFSNTTALQLCEFLSKTASMTDRFLVYVEYEIDTHHFVSVFMIQDTKGLIFTKDKVNSIYDIKELTHLDLDRLTMACRVDVDGYLTTKERYLSVISKKNEVSDYFAKWIGAVNKETSVTYTNDFRTLINLAKLPTTETGAAIEREAMTEKIYDIYKDDAQNLINLTKISSVLYNDDKYLTELALKNNILINTEFTPDKTIMKKLVRVDIESDGINLRFSRNDWKTKKVKVVGNQVIIDSPALVFELHKEFDNGIVGPR